jgi:adenylosuccinate synthase
MSGRLVVVVGGQFGSEGKGAAAGHLVTKLFDPMVIRTGGPNAGHTAYSPDGQQFKLRQLPTAAVTTRAELAISAGSLVDLEVLEQEMQLTGCGVWVDRAATILEPRHVKQEQTDPDLRWGSTCKGIGAARADRIHRTALTWGDMKLNLGLVDAVGVDVAARAREKLQAGKDVLIEAAQGYGLGLHTPYYPKTTSADCRAIDALADVGLSPWEFSIPPEVWVVVRPYPIRVAGDSGPLLEETSWEELGLPQERTTVTNKVRRVGLWDDGLVTAAIAANGGKYCRVWLSMADQVVPEIAGMTEYAQLESLPFRAWQNLQLWLDRVGSCGAPIGAIGTGPATAVVIPPAARQ